MNIMLTPVKKVIETPQMFPRQAPRSLRVVKRTLAEEPTDVLEMDIPENNLDPEPPINMSELPELEALALEMRTDIEPLRKSTFSQTEDEQIPELFEPPATLEPLEPLEIPETAEYGLNPQLQEILQLLSNPDGVMICAKEHFERILNQKLGQIENRLDEVIRTVELAKNFPSATVEKLPVQRQLTTDSSKTDPNKSSKGYLADIITDYSNDVSVRAIDNINAYFPMFYVFNVEKKGREMCKYLKDLGLNVLLVDPALPKHLATHHILIQYYIDALDNATENKYPRVVFVRDNLLPHHDLIRILNLTLEQIRGTDWTMLQLCYPEAKSPRWNKDIDADYYLKSYPDLYHKGIKTPQQAMQHWTQNGHREGRIGKLSVKSITASTPEAFALQQGDYDKLRKELYRAANTRDPTTFLSYKNAVLVGVQPSLFIPFFPSPAIYYANRWFPGSYIRLEDIKK